MEHKVSKIPMNGDTEKLSFYSSLFSTDHTVLDFLVNYLGNLHKAMWAGGASS